MPMYTVSIRAEHIYNVLLAGPCPIEQLRQMQDTMFWML